MQAFIGDATPQNNTEDNSSIIRWIREGSASYFVLVLDWNLYISSLTGFNIKWEIQPIKLYLDRYIKAFLRSLLKIKS